MTPFSGVREIARKLRIYQRNYLTRRQLAQLDDSALKDIGISRAEALQEARKPFWVDHTDTVEESDWPLQTGIGVATASCALMALLWMF